MFSKCIFVDCVDHIPCETTYGRTQSKIDYVCNHAVLLNKCQNYCVRHEAITCEELPGKFQLHSSLVQKITEHFTNHF